jgi:hypothetical protein
MPVASTDSRALRPMKVNLNRLPIAVEEKPRGNFRLRSLKSELGLTASAEAPQCQQLTLRRVLVEPAVVLAHRELAASPRRTSGYAKGGPKVIYGVNAGLHPHKLLGCPV